jgi:RNA polymerase sigma factor (sigma-70 family)
MKEIAPLNAENIEDSSDIPEPVDMIEKTEEKLAPFADGTVAATVVELPPDQRRLIVLRYEGDQTMAEIAAETGTSVPAVSQRFSTIHETIAHALAA